MNPPQAPAVHETDVGPLLYSDRFGGQQALRELVSAIRAATGEDGQMTWLTDGEGGERICAIVSTNSGEEAEQAGQPEPPFDENHHRYHAPAGPNPACANCSWRGWPQP